MAIIGEQSRAERVMSRRWTVSGTESRILNDAENGDKNSQTPPILLRCHAQSQKKDDVGMSTFSHDPPFPFKVLHDLSSVLTRQSFFVSPRSHGRGRWGREGVEAVTHMIFLRRFNLFNSNIDPQVTPFDQLYPIRFV